MIYSTYSKKRELEKIENYLTSIEHERNRLIQSIENKKELLIKTSNKISELSKSHDRLSHILALVNLLYILDRKNKKESKHSFKE